MSSCGNPNADGDSLMARRVKFDGKTEICVKCKNTRGNIVVRYAIYCKSCFFYLVQIRFKKSLEPFVNSQPDGPRRKGLEAAGSLVIGFSGGTCSTALVDLIVKTYFSPRPPVTTEISKGGKDHPRNTERRVWKGNPAVCYVEVCGAFPDKQDMTEEIRAAIARYPGTPFEFIPLRLEDSFDSTWWRGVGGEMRTDALRLNMIDEDLPFVTTPSLSSNDSPLISLKRYLAALPTQTAFSTAIHNLVRLMLLHTAASRQASHLLLGTSLTSLSVNLISSISQGSGFAIVEEIQEEWMPRSPSGLPIRIVRPLRDIGTKDCAIWNWWHGLRLVNRPLRQSSVEVKSIDTLTRNFIFGLETDYPATVSTIARTCAKLTAKESSNTVCVLCGRPAQRDVQDWKKQTSIRSYSNSPNSAFSEDLLSTQLSLEAKTVEVSGSVRPRSLVPSLCYGCHTTLTSRGSRGLATSLTGSDSVTNVPLPIWVQDKFIPAHSPVPSRDLQDDDSSVVKLSRGDMRALIEDFLLPDS